jgi:hypothetical protein
MSETNTLARTLHDVGLAAWFGGTLMGAVGLNSASAEVSDARERAVVADAGWSRWRPLNLAAIAAHLAGAAQLVNANKGRIAAQEGVATASGAKTALTVAALAASAYSGLLGKKISKANGSSGDGVPAEDGVTPAPATPPEVAKAQRQLKSLQWAVPLLTGSLLVVSSRMAEQQRPTEVASGILGRLGRSSQG